MRFSEPSIADGLRGARRRGRDDGRRDHPLAAVLAAPHGRLRAGDREARGDARRRGARRRGRRCLARRAGVRRRAGAVAIVEALATSAAGRARAASAVLMTAHSLPKRVAEQEPDYLAQLRATAEAVAAAAGLSDRRLDLLLAERRPRAGRVDEARLRRPDARDRRGTAGARCVVAPVQFLADHLEILYDVDVGAREQAERCGLSFLRIASLNTDADLIEALAAVARRTLKAGQSVVPASRSRDVARRPRLAGAEPG